METSPSRPDLWQPCVELEGVDVVYGEGATQVPALRKLSVSIPQGQFVCVLGPSGSGKSTLLHVLAGLLRPTNGTVNIVGTPIHTMTMDQAARWRRQNLGMVHQFFNLIPTLTVVQNVAVPLLLEGIRLRKVQDRVDDLLDQVGILERRNHSLDELSGGEMQRVAIARALIASPRLILADEPTGNLDTRTGTDVLGTFRELTRERGVTLVMVTHDLSSTSYADRIITLQDGSIVEDTGTENLPGSA